MQQKRKVTIITPTFDRLDSLKEAVDCVIKQSYQNWEYFIVADGHDPRVRRLVQNLNDKRIKYLFTLHTGYVGHLQRTFALKFAKGEFVFCLDDDNIIRRDYIEKMVDGFTDKETGYVVCQIDYGDGRFIKPQLPLRVGNIDMLNYMVRTDLAKKVGGWIPFDLYEADYIFIAKISKISKGKFVPEILGVHRRLKKQRKEPINIETKSATVSEYHKYILEIKSLFKKATLKLLRLTNIPTDLQKTGRTHINRAIYHLLCKVWLKW